MAEHKRRYKCVVRRDTDVAVDGLEKYGEAFLADIMRELHTKLKTPVLTFEARIALWDVRNPEVPLAGAVYDALMEESNASNRPNESTALKKKGELGSKSRKRAPRMASPELGESSVRAAMSSPVA